MFVVLTLSELLEQQGKVDEAVAVLHTQVDAGHSHVEILLVEMLARHGMVETLLPLALEGDILASIRLVPLLTERRMMKPLRRLAQAGNTQAASYLAGLLTEQGETDEGNAWLRARSDAAQARSVTFALWLVERGKTDKALALLRTISDDSPLADTLVAHLSSGQNTILASPFCSSCRAAHGGPLEHGSASRY